MHRLPHLLGHLQERLDQPRGHGIRLVQQCRDQARHRLPEAVGKPGKMERRLGAQGLGQDPAQAGRQARSPAQDIRQSEPAADRRLLRTVHLRLPAPAQCAGNEGAADRAPALAPDRGAHGENRRRAELGGNPRRGIRQALQGLEFRGHAEGDVRPVRKHLHDVSAAPVRALPQSDLRRVLPVGLDLQARGRRHRPHRPGQMPRLAHVRVGLPVQEDLLQLVHRQGGEVHFLLSAHRVGTADGVLGNLRRAHPLPRRDALRCRPHSRGGERGEREGPVQGAARAVPRPACGRSPGAGARRRRARGLDPGGAAVARLQDGDGVEGGAAAASGVPHAADGLVRAAAVADQRCRQRGTARRLRRVARRAQPAHPGAIPRQSAHRRRRGAGGGGARAHARDARLHARPACGAARERRRAEAGGLVQGRGRADVPLHGDRQLRGPLRHPDHAPRIRRKRLRPARRLRLLLRQRLLRRPVRGEPVRRQEAQDHPDQGR